MKDHEPEIAKSDVSTHALIGAVRNALAESGEIDMSNIAVRAGNGVVYLTGTVDTMQQKEAAVRIARRTPGGKYVENDLAISASKSESDSILFDKVSDVLGSFPVDDPARIGVRAVGRGIVYLSGKAKNVFEVRRAVELAESVPGVKQVISEIDVAPGELADEIGLKNSVMDELDDDPRVNPYSIKVCIDKADVYLDGEVDDEESIEAAGELASQARGVKHVINRLKRR
jgi:osmotically-inducible protein OsmY